MATSVVVAEGKSERRSMDAILGFPREGNGLCGGDDGSISVSQRELLR